MTRRHAALSLLRAGAVLAGLAIVLAAVHLGASTDWQSDAGRHQFHESSTPRSVGAFAALGFITILAVSYPLRARGGLVVSSLGVLGAVAHALVLFVALEILAESSGRAANVAIGVALSSLLALLGLVASLAIRASARKAVG